MSRRVLFVHLLTAGVVYPAGVFESFEIPPPSASLSWSEESYDSVPDVTSPETPKAPALTPVSAASVPPSKTLLHQGVFVEDWRPASNLDGSCGLNRSPPFV
jgi:hypothetical protein